MSEYLGGEGIMDPQQKSNGLAGSRAVNTVMGIKKNGLLSSSRVPFPSKS